MTKYPADRRETGRRQAATERSEVATTNEGMTKHETRELRGAVFPLAAARDSWGELLAAEPTSLI